MNKDNKIEKALKNIDRMVKDLMDSDMLDLGISACYIRDGKVNYIDPLDPKNFHLFPNQYGDEIWKDIPEYEKYYQCSNFGRIKSLERVIYSKRNKSLKTLKPKLKYQYIDKYGYANCQLSKGGINKSFRVHKLVAMTFLNHKPDGTQKVVVNHINLIKLDNRLINLELTTQRKNANKKHLKSTSKYVGVHWSKQKNKWVAQITYGTKHKYLGSFTKEYDAHLAYQKELI